MPGASAEGARGAAGHYLTGRESPIHQQSLCRCSERMDDEEGGGGGGVLVALIKSRPFGGDPGIEQVQYFLA